LWLILSRELFFFRTWNPSQRIASLQHDIVELTGSLSANNKGARFSLAKCKP